ncbi:MAG: hypothetical protein ACHQHK_13820 [Dongiales bacterium]
MGSAVKRRGNFHFGAGPTALLLAPMIRRIGIVGAGAWGTALAIIAERAGREVILWARRT